MSFWVFLQNNVMYVHSKTPNSPWHLVCIPQIVSTFAHRWLPDAGIDAELLQLTVTVTLSMCYTHVTCNVSLVSLCSVMFKSFIYFIKDAEKGNFHSDFLLLVIIARGLFFKWQCCLAENKMSCDEPCHSKDIELQYDRANRTIPTVNFIEK